MASINQVTLLGNLGQDPEIRFTSSGTPVATCSVATSRKWTDSKGQEKESVQWHRVVIWGKGAEWLVDNKRKGDQVLIVGHLQTREYDDTKIHDDLGRPIKRYVTEIVARQWDPYGGVYGLYGSSPRPAKIPPPREPEDSSSYIPDDEVPF